MPNLEAIEVEDVKEESRKWEVRFHHQMGEEDDVLPHILLESTSDSSSSKHCWTPVA